MLSDLVFYADDGKLTSLSRLPPQFSVLIQLPLIHSKIVILEVFENIAFFAFYGLSQPTPLKKMNIISVISIQNWIGQYIWELSTRVTPKNVPLLVLRNCRHNQKQCKFQK